MAAVGDEQGTCDWQFSSTANLQQLQLKFPQQLRCQQQQAVVLDKNVEWKMSITKELSDRLEDGRQLKMPTVVKENARIEVSVLVGHTSLLLLKTRHSRNVA